jgi:hypothetical protein
MILVFVGLESWTGLGMILKSAAIHHCSIFRKLLGVLDVRKCLKMEKGLNSLETVAFNIREILGSKGNCNHGWRFTAPNNCFLPREGLAPAMLDFEPFLAELDGETS